MRLPRVRHRTAARTVAPPRVLKVVGELKLLAWQVCGLKSATVHVDPADDSLRFIDRRTGLLAALTRYGFTTRERKTWVTIRRFDSAEIDFLKQSWVSEQEYYGATLLKGFQGSGLPRQRRGSTFVQGGRPDSNRRHH